jgi:ADP-ribose pyrophosphatase YjhB (NUDIX family)
MNEYYIEHQKILLSVDCIIFGFEDYQLKVLIGHRNMDPGRGAWSLYGGFVRNDESLDEAADRTLFELTGLHHVYMRQVGAFGNVDRDPGARVVSIAYYALINVKDYDRSLLEKHNVQWVNIDELPEMFSDHQEMIAKARKLMQVKMKTQPVGFELLPPLFTLTQLQRLYEAVQGAELDKRNFRKRIKEMVCIEKTRLIDKTGSKRGAFLYRFNEKTYREQEFFRL